MKMQFLQSRWVQINLTALARVYVSPKLNESKKVMLDELLMQYSATIIQKLKVEDSRKHLAGNDFAAIAFQLKKMRFTGNPELFIFIENQLLNCGVGKIALQSLIVLIQAFKSNALHSQVLFNQTLLAIHQSSKGFKILDLHEVAILISRMGSFWNTAVSIQINNDLEARVRDMVSEETQERQIWKYGSNGYHHQIGKILEGLISISVGNNGIIEMLTSAIFQKLSMAEFD